jgi:CubicO group peptidase (beta-lactamase class C family)
MKLVTQTIHKVLDDTSIPSISIQIFQLDKANFHYTSGYANTSPLTPARPQQVYDLASLTKPLVGSSVVAQMLDSGDIELDKPVSHYIEGANPKIRLGHLLNHSSGLPAHIHFYSAFTQDKWGEPTTRNAIFRGARTSPLLDEPGASHRYSDLGFILLCEVLEAIDGQRLDAVFRQRVQAPLRLAGFEWGHPSAAATEYCPIRGRIVTGRVHDLNCAAMSGISAHAGLFGSAGQVMELAKAFLGCREFSLPRAQVKALWATTGPGSHQGGWDTTSPGYTSTGAHFPPDTVGHLGYTGTSLWLAPSRNAAVVLLTNRVHPRDDLTDIRAARPIIHDSVAQALGWDTR